jgi:elongation factor Ts
LRENVLMAAITAQAVNEFRKRTGLGLMECKALLVEAEGDLAKAETLAKEKGVIKAAGRAGRLTNAGRVEVAFGPDHATGAIVELNCETDFVARNDAFREAARDLAQQVLAHGADGLADQKFHKNPAQTIAALITELNSRTGENISVGKAARFEGGRVEAYIHHDAKSAALVEVSGSAGPEALSTLARDLALQVVAARPVAVGRDDVPADLVEEQRRINLALVANTMGDKPEAVREKIATGKLDAWFKENTLLDQEFVKDPSKKVREVVAAVGADTKVGRFARVAVGEAAPETPATEG